eukprot:6205367-Pleurochrysis_carterae.AAC.3
MTKGRSVEVETQNASGVPRISQESSKSSTSDGACAYLADVSVQVEQILAVVALAAREKTRASTVYGRACGAKVDAVVICPRIAFCSFDDSEKCKESQQVSCGVKWRVGAHVLATTMCMPSGASCMPCSALA